MKTVYGKYKLDLEREVKILIPVTDPRDNQIYLEMKGDEASVFMETGEIEITPECKPKLH